MGRKTALSKSNLRALLQFLFSNKIVLTYSDVELFEQGLLYAVST